MWPKPRLYLLIVVVLLITACVPQPTSKTEPSFTETAVATVTPQPALLLDPSATPTPTPSPAPQISMTATAGPSDTCAGLRGYLDVQLVVGPSEAVGLEPVVVGQLPFAVVADTSPWLLTGATALSYQDTLVETWGSFDVLFDADMSVEGTCRGAGTEASLEMAVTMDGEQLVTVTSEGFSADYPWAGTQTREFILPAENGAMAQGEGWAFTLHLEGSSQ